jgi:hypothetical protein
MRKGWLSGASTSAECVWRGNNGLSGNTALIPQRTPRQDGFDVI